MSAPRVGGGNMGGGGMHASVGRPGGFVGGVRGR
jgi:hypothetical protein